MKRCKESPPAELTILEEDDETAANAAGGSFLTRAMVRSVDFYRREISPYKGGPCCRFVPTCSQYALTALARFGAVKGGSLAAHRLLRCHPWSDGGYDPVPDDPCTTLRKG